MNKDIENKIQYNAAVKYLEKNSYKINKTNFLFYFLFFGIFTYFIVLYILKITSCL
jgi:hypothetical protein